MTKLKLKKPKRHKRTRKLKKTEQKTEEPTAQTTQTVPTDVKPNTGNMNIYKGIMSKVQFSIWDSVPVCTTTCIAYNQCPKRIKEDVLNPPKCAVRVRYLEAVLGTLKLGIKRKDAITVHKIGMMLIPLYNQLVGMKIAELSMNQDNNVMFGAKINPIYKEMRSTIQLIDKILDGFNIKGGHIGAPGTVTDTEINGNGAYYDTLFTKEGENECHE